MSRDAHPSTSSKSTTPPLEKLEPAERFATVLERVQDRKLLRTSSTSVVAEIEAGRIDRESFVASWTEVLRRYEEGEEGRGGLELAAQAGVDEEGSPVHARSLCYMRRLSQGSVLSFATSFAGDDEEKVSIAEEPSALRESHGHWRAYRVVECGDEGLRIDDGEGRLFAGDWLRVHPEDDVRDPAKGPTMARVAAVVGGATLEGRVRRRRKIFDYDGPGERDEYRLLIAPAESLVEAPRRTFDEKLAALEESLTRLRVPWQRGHQVIRVSRRNWGDSLLAATLGLGAVEFRQTWVFQIDDEPGHDDGGVARECWNLAMAELADPHRGLFRYADTDETAIQIKPQGQWSVAVRDAYWGFGRLVAKALLDRQIIAVHLTVPMLKHVLGRPVRFSDLKFVDAPLHHSCQWMLDNQGVEALCITFEHNDRDSGKPVELVSGGSKRPVTDRDKDEFVARLFKYAMLDQIARPLTAFLKGFYAVLPLDVLRDATLAPHDLALALAGRADVDVNDWRKHTALAGGLYKSMPLVKHFWAYVRDLDPARRAKLLQFVTGSSRLPPSGFRNLRGRDGPQKFTLKGKDIVVTSDDAPPPLPAASTCFNQLVLPKYSSYDQLKSAFDAILDEDVAFFSTS